MRNLFTPKCPVDVETKTWIEHRFSWLTEEFGIHRLVSSTTMLPNAEYLPLEYDCSETGIAELMRRVVSKRGYLSMHAIGYALSLYALARGETRPVWIKYLRPDAKAYVSRGIRYISKMRDCAFAPAIERVG